MMLQSKSSILTSLENQLKSLESSCVTLQAQRPEEVGDLMEKTKSLIAKWTDFNSRYLFYMVFSCLIYMSKYIA